MARQSFLRGPSSLLRRAHERALDALQQFVVPKRFWKKIYCASLHRLRAHGDVAVACNEDKLFLSAPLNQTGLKIDSVEPGHLHIDDHTGRSRVLFACKKISCRDKRFIFV